MFTLAVVISPSIHLADHLAVFITLLLTQRESDGVCRPLAFPPAFRARARRLLLKCTSLVPPSCVESERVSLALLVSFSGLAPKGERERATAAAARHKFVSTVRVRRCSGELCVLRTLGPSTAAENAGRRHSLPLSLLLLLLLAIPFCQVQQDFSLAVQSRCGMEAWCDWCPLPRRRALARPFEERVRSLAHTHRRRRRRGCQRQHRHTPVFWRS